MIVSQAIEDFDKVTTMRKVLNFSAGPAMLPDEVLLQAQAELLDWQGTGMSIMELGHRGPEFKIVAEQAEADLRELMAIPDNYKVLFVPGGASAQFTMVPVNLFGPNMTAEYVDSGFWSKKAITEAKRFGTVNIAASRTLKDNLAYIPHQSEWALSPNAAYVHYTPNETIDGLEFQWVPKTGNVPLVADMTSMILSRPVNVNDYGIIYAGAQKNAGQAGITIVIVRDDLIKETLPGIPSLYSYKLHAENHSLFNTPPTYSWYITGLVLSWMKRHGGVGAFYELNQRKAGKIYSLVDEYKDFYVTTIHPECRSLMNVSFQLRDDNLSASFLLQAEENNLCNLRGHRSSGGFRASIYNAFPEAGVDKLVEFMRHFALRNG